MSQYLSLNRIEEPIWLEPTELAFLREQAESLEAQISELTRQRDAKLAELATFRNILSPVRRIPVEILSKIFQLACHPKDGIFNSKLVVVLYMRNLTSVCMAWRKVALATPQLWSKLCINDRTKVLADVEWVKKWAHRSRSLPLDVYISLYRDVSAPLLERILECRHQIRTLDVGGYPKSYAALFNLPRSSFSQLEQVTLSFERSEWHPFLGKIRAFLDAPNLQHVQIKGPACSPALLQALVFPVEQLTTLSFTSESIISDAACVVYIDIVHACRDLVSLEIALPLRRGLTSNMSILLPALKSLKIVCHNLYDNLLCCLTLPLLERLTLCGYCGEDISDTLTNLADFRRRSAASLSCLTLEGFNGKDVETLTVNLMVTIGMFPEIQSLQLHRLQFDINPFLRALTHTEGNQVLLPKLTYFGLQIDEQHPSRIPDDLTTMILSRWWPDERATSAGVVRLQKVTLRGFYYDEKTKITFISELPGLEIDEQFQFLCSPEYV